MKVIVTNNHSESCQKTADIIIDIINHHPNPVLGLATGGTAEQVYDALVASYQKKEISFKNVNTINLDEYIGLSSEHPQSYRFFMNKFLFNRVDILMENTFVPDGNRSIDSSLKEFQDVLAKKPRDFQLLGVGLNGHIAFNEPDSILHADAHIVNIAESTIKANARYFENENHVPKQAFTQGMGDILKAKKIVILATGSNKASAMKSLLLTDEITTKSPCTFLKIHADVVVFLDKELADEIGFNCRS